MSALRQSYAGHVFSAAVERLLSARMIERDAEQAASVMAFVARRLELEERELSDLVRIADRWIAHAGIVRNVMNALRARATPAEAPKLLPGVLRLASRASAGGCAGSVFVLVCAMGSEAAWSPHVESTWVAQALDHVSGERQKHPATHELLSSLARPALAPKLREVVEHRPDLLTSLSMPPWLAWRVQIVAPTVDGWRALASRSPRDGDLPAAATFASQLDVAIDTLEAAVSAESESVRRVLLARWSFELRGTP